MDQWTEATWLSRANPPTLRAVAGRSLRVLPRHGEPTPLGADPAAIRVLVVSDDELARRGVLATLDDQPGLVVVGEQRSGLGVAAAIVSRHPDVLLLHGLHGDDAAPTLTDARQASRSVRVLSIGARGELPASASPEEVVAAIRLAAAGYVLSRSAQHRTATPAGGSDRHGRAAALADGLTDRECGVLALVATGMSNAEIAAELTLSEHTVKSHMQNLLGKLRLRNRIHAVIYAFDIGLARPAGE